jgi:hypothetical protein
LVVGGADLRGGTPGDTLGSTLGDILGGILGISILLICIYHMIGNSFFKIIKKTISKSKSIKRF